MKSKVLIVMCCGLLVNSQIHFEEEAPPRRQQFGNNVLVISFERPNQSSQQGFRRPPQNQNQQPFFQNQGQNNFGFGSQNNGFRQPQSTFGSSSSSSSSSSSFGSQQQPFQGNHGFRPNNQNNNNFQQQQQSGFHQSQNEVVVESRLPDCRTYFDSEGVCTPLNACGRITRDIQNRSPTVVARILGRSICGFSGIIPKVCCPSSRVQSAPPSPPTTFRPFPNKQNDFSNFDKNNGDNANPGFGNNNGKGNGLVIIPPSTQPSTTTTTPPPFEIIEPVKNTGGNTGEGLVIGEGPIALVPPQQGKENLGYSDKGLPPNCGISNATHTRIVGGKVAEKGAWPWIAALGYKDNAGNVNYLCGGALVSPNYVVTASHCAYGRDDLYSVRLGDHDLYSTSDGVNPIEVEVDKTILHPNYDPATFKNDIALLHLKTPVPLSLKIHPVCLPTTPELRNSRFENTSPFVAGWGAIQFNGPSSSVLREVQVPTVPDSVCQEKYSSFKTAVVDDSNLCAGLQRGGQDACQGDSGGPLQQPVGTNRYVLIGVVSFGFKCAEPNFPGVYTRVTSHLDWIQNIINKQ